MNICSGVPWIFEVISSAIAAEDGFDETCLVRLGLDIPNLLAVDGMNAYMSLTSDVCSVAGYPGFLSDCCKEINHKQLEEEGR